MSDLPLMDSRNRKHGVSRRRNAKKKANRAVVRARGARDMLKIRCSEPKRKGGSEGTDIETIYKERAMGFPPRDGAFSWSGRGGCPPPPSSGPRRTGLSLMLRHTGGARRGRAIHLGNAHFARHVTTPSPIGRELQTLFVPFFGMASCVEFGAKRRAATSRSVRAPSCGFGEGQIYGARQSASSALGRIVEFWRLRRSLVSELLRIAIRG